MKVNDPLKIASEIKAINHEIECAGVKVDLPLTAFIKALYPSYSHYLESLQASGQLKDLDFHKLVGKNAEREKRTSLVILLEPISRMRHTHTD